LTTHQYSACLNAEGAAGLPAEIRSVKYETRELAGTTHGLQTVV